MYFEYQNLVALSFLMFFSLVAVGNKGYKLALGVAFLGIASLFVPTQFFIDYANFIFPSR